MIRLTLRHAVSFSSCGCEKRPRRTWKLPRRRGFPIEPIVLTGVTAQLLGVNSSGCAIVTHSGIFFLCGDIAMHHIDRAQFVRTDASFHYGFDACGTIEVPASLLLDQRYRQRPVVCTDLEGHGVASTGDQLMPCTELIHKRLESLMVRNLVSRVQQ